MTQPQRDLMAPDTEPTDEELETVMQAARDVAAARLELALAELRGKIEERVRELRDRHLGREDAQAR